MAIKNKISQILTREEPIAGLEISDSFVRLVFLERDERKKTINIKTQKEETISGGAILDGKVQNGSLLEESLKKLGGKLNVALDNVVVSIPSNVIYSKILTFPRNMEREKLEEAINLAINFQLPFKMEEMYASWEIIQGSLETKVFVAAAPKKIIDGFLNALKKTKFHPVALESYPLSLLRILSLPKNQSFLFKLSDQSGNSFFIFKDKILRFQRSLGRAFPAEKVETELDRIKNYYESDGETLTKIIDLKTEPPVLEKDYGFFAQKKEENQWLFAMGAAARGLIPREKDNLISLLPISTQKAYEYKRVVSFASFLSKITVGVSIFFVLAFSGIFLFLSSLQQRTIKQLQNLSSLPVPPEVSQMEQKAQEVNVLIAVSAEIVKKTPQWSKVFEELRARMQSGIIVTGLNLSSPETVMVMTGIAADRNTLNNFKKKLSESDMLTEIKLPLTNIEQRGNIPFNISFQLKDPQSIYYK